MLARRPRLLLLDEPTTGLDPVARHEILAELMDVVRDERRAILFSSHNTQDVEQISDVITFIDRGRIIDSSDKETFLDRWRRSASRVPAGVALPRLPGVVDTTTSGRLAVVTTNAYTPDGSASTSARASRLDGATDDARGDLRRQRHEQPPGAGRMSAPIVRQLILKDLYLLRWMIRARSIGAGAAAIAIMPLEPGLRLRRCVSLICTLIILNIFLVMNGVAQEKKDKVHPLHPEPAGLDDAVPGGESGGERDRVSRAVARADGRDVRGRSISRHSRTASCPSGLPCSVYLLCYYCALLAVGLVSDSAGWHATAIIVGNISFNFLIPFLLRLPSVAAHAKGAAAVWTGDIVAILGCRAVFAVAALSHFVPSRRLRSIAHRGLRLRGARMSTH